MQAAVAGRPEEAERRLRSASGAFREIGIPFWVAVTELELGEWLGGRERTTEAEELLGAARSTFERLGARPWLDRLDRAVPVGASG